jgi:membrane protease YdiL (CAAX protease family)
LLQIIAVLIPLVIGNTLLRKMGGSLRAGLWIGIPAFAAAILMASMFLHSEGRSWSDLGLAMPRNWLKTILFVALTAVVVSVGIGLVRVVAYQVLGAAAPDISRFAALRGNLPLLVFGLIGVWITAAFGEELIARGFLLDRLISLFGGGRGAVALAVIVTSLFFGLGHLFQGAAGVIAAVVAGFLYAIFYLLSGRNLWVTILAHGLVDTIGFMVIYASPKSRAALPSYESPGSRPRE